MLTISDVMGLKKRKDVNGLIRALQYRGDTAVRAEAALSLGQLGDVQAVDSLVSTLQSDSDPYVRSLAATALGDLGDARARSALLSALQNDTMEVGAAASKALSRLRG
jgi:HEAT repeat protein